MEFCGSDRVPLDYQVDFYNETEWNSIRSDWMTAHNLSTYFGDGAWELTPKTVNEIRQFAADVARDIRAA